jgi:hypothetical protein
VSPRGGYRPGSGPQKGAKYRPRKPKDGQPAPAIEAKKPPKAPKNAPESSEKANSRALIALGIKVKQKWYQEFMQRVANKDKDGNPLNLPPLTFAEKKFMAKLEEDIKAETLDAQLPDDILDGATSENLDPLPYMLKVMNDPQAGKDRRDRMAVSAAPYMHPRVGEGLGKKEEKNERAKAAAGGKYASMNDRLKVVK